MIPEVRKLEKMIPNFNNKSMIVRFDLYFYRTSIGNKPIDVDEEIAEAITDWHYWVKMGYEF